MMKESDMLPSIGRFLAYNNTVPLIFGILFLGASGAFAASPEVRDSVFSSSQVVKSIDNARIVNADLTSFPFTVEINAVTEDATTYVVSYTLSTIDLVDGVWQDVHDAKTLAVEKTALQGGDLGLYATKQIAEVRDSERTRLIETQRIEQTHGETQKIVSTTYGGLVGKFLDPTTETFAGYQPVVTPPENNQNDTVPVTTAVAPAADANVPATVSSQEPAQGGVVAGASSHSSGDPSDPVPPSISILGNNPARITVGSTYADFGAVVTDNVTFNLGYQTLLDGVLVLSLSIDTTVPGTHTITYRTSDQAGNTAEASRTVEVYAL